MRLVTDQAVYGKESSASRSGPFPETSASPRIGVPLPSQPGLKFRDLSGPFYYKGYPKQENP